MRTFLTRLAVFLLALAVVPVTGLGQRGAGGAAPPPTGGRGASPMNAAPLPPGAGAISGVVVDAATGTPIPGAVVSIGIVGRAIAMSQRSQVADGKGRFAFVNLPASPGFTLIAAKTGYLDGGYGRDRVPTDPLREISLREGEWNGTVRLALWRPSAISGTVRDERGDPVVGVYVRTLIRARVQGREDLVAGPATTTDDRGMYRLAGLSPARYYVEVPSVQASAPESLPFNASSNAKVIDGALQVDGATSRLFIGRYPLPPPPQNGRTLVYPIAFHPAGSGIAEAAPIDLKFGDDRAGIDVMLEPVTVARVSGTVEGPPEALRSLTLRLLPAGLETLGPGSESATALVDESGRFTFLNVPPGSYVVDAPRTIGEYRWNGALGGRGSALPPPPSKTTAFGASSFATDTPGVFFSVTDFRSGAQNYSGKTSVTVGAADVTNLVVTLRAHTTISGWYKIEADPSKPVAQTFPSFAWQADPASGNTSLGLPRSMPDPDALPDEFWIGGLGQGEYYLRSAGAGPWLIKSIQWKGHEYADMPFDAATATAINGVLVTMTNAVPTFGGTVRQADGTPVPAATVIVFPVDHALWSNTGLTPPRFKTFPTMNGGVFRAVPMPAGEYLAVALPSSQVGAWRDLEFLARIERLATRVSLSWGRDTMQDLTVRSVK